MEEKFFVTGATGFIGSHIVSSLLRKGERVACLVRGRNEREAEDRLLTVLSNIPLYVPADRKRLQVVCGDITQDGLGINNTEVLKGVRHFIHSAANVDFDSGKSDGSFTVNLKGAEEAVRLASACSVPNFYHISTAYVSGKKSGLITETLDHTERPFNNAYEQSKAAAEIVLSRIADENNMNLAILRPGIVVGDSVHGYTPRLNAIYNFLAPLVRIRHKADSEGNGNSQKVSRTGCIALPVQVIGYGDSLLNLVPVDFVVNALSAIIERQKTGVHIYHIVDIDPPTMREVVNYVSGLLNINGVELVQPEEYFSSAKTGIAKLFLKQNKTYMNYTTSRALYEARNLAGLLEGGRWTWNKRQLFQRMIAFTQNRIVETLNTVPTGRYEDIVRYFDEFLKKKTGERLIKNLRDFTSSFTITISNTPLSPWSVTIDSGVLISVSQNGKNPEPLCGYVVNASAFRSIIRGVLSPQDGFFRGDVDIRGDIRHGLKLASLMELFFKEHAYSETEEAIQ